MFVDSYEQMVDLVDSCKKIAICGHVDPDGDCLGSVLALSLALIKSGHDVSALLAKNGGMSRMYRFLPGSSMLMDPDDCTEDVDLFISLDTPGEKRLGDAVRVRSRASHTIAIDHHPDMVDFAELSYRDSGVSAAGMLVWDLIRALGIDPDEDIASCCYVALMTDTGRFQFQNTNAASFEHAREFTEAGASPAKLATAVYQNRSAASMALESRVMGRVQFISGGKIAYSYVTTDDFKEFSVTKDDTEGLPDRIRCIAGVQIACVLREQDGKIKGSMRAKGTADVGSVARALGGGGHRAAAGFAFDGTLDEAVSALLPLLEEA